MGDGFKIFVERLKDGEREVLNETFSPAFICIDEPELRFEAPVRMEGEAFVCGDTFVISARVSTRAQIPCAICNEFTEVFLEIAKFDHAEKVDEVKGGVYNLAPLLRETILLEVPSRAECEGRCPHRETIEKYLFKESRSFPFESLGEE